MSRNLGASVRARLKNRADATGSDYNLMLTHYGLERLLYRLSISSHASQFVLKGALLFKAWHDLPQRPTRDADLLGFGSHEVADVAAVFVQVCQIAVEDGIAFDPRSVDAQVIRKDAGYGGVRVAMLATLGGARIDLQVDVAFGDVVTPAAGTMHYPVLLADLPAPHLRAYPRDTVIAEKLHALCELGLPNSRMKDYFDLDVLRREGATEVHGLARAVSATFARRGRPLPAEIPVGLTEEFANDAQKQAQWAAFLRKNRLEAPSLDEVVRGLVGWLMAAIAGALEIRENAP